MGIISDDPELESGIQSWWAATKRRRAWKETALELIRLHETVQMMIELGFMIKSAKYFQEIWLQPENWNFPPEPGSPKTSAGPDTPHLTGEEKQNPFLVLIKNWKLDIGWFRDELNRRLEAAMDTEMNIDDTYDTLGNIIKIIEALYVINDAIPDILFFHRN